LFAVLRADIAKRARNLIAPLKIVDAVEAACTLPFEQASRPSAACSRNAWSRPV